MLACARQTALERAVDEVSARICRGSPRSGNACASDWNFRRRTILPGRCGRIQQDGALVTVVAAKASRASALRVQSSVGGSTFTTSPRWPERVVAQVAPGTTWLRALRPRGSGQTRCPAERWLSQPRSGREPHLLDRNCFLQKTRSSDPLSTCSYGAGKSVCRRQRRGHRKCGAWGRTGQAAGGADPGRRSRQGLEPVARLVQQRLAVAAMSTTGTFAVSRYRPARRLISPWTTPDPGPNRSMHGDLNDLRSPRRGRTLIAPATAQPDSARR
jgi:hypothetical protein